jgi:hypothetical protein
MTVEQPQPVDGQVADLSRRCDALKAVLQRLAEDNAGAEALQGLITAGALALLDIKASRCPLVFFVSALTLAADCQAQRRRQQQS